MLGSLAHLGAFKVFFLLERPAVAYLLHQDDQVFVNDLVDALVVVALLGSAVVGLARGKLLEVQLLVARHCIERQLALHFKQYLVDLHKLLAEVWSQLDQLSGEVFAGLVVHALPDIALPEAENLANQVVLEELHAGQDAEHRALAHPLGQRQELGRSAVVQVIAVAAVFM